MYDEVEKSYLWIDAIIKGQAELNDKFQIEDVLLAMRNYSKKLEFLKELKRRRVESIDNEVQTIEQNMAILQEAIMKCMNSHSEKSLDFPGVAKVSVRKTKGTWQINDEHALRVFLESNNIDDNLIENTWKFKKKELNKVLDDLQINNNVPSCVSREDTKQSVSISYNKEEKTEASVKITASKEQSKDDFDKIVI